MSVDFEKEGRIAIITMNRPEKLNAINAEQGRAMNEALLRFRDDPDLWVGIITGAGERAFSAGADITGFLDRGSGERDDREERVSGDNIWKPLIAAIHGYCLGGGLEIALKCDIRIAADDSRLGLPEIKVGVIAGGGGVSRLPRFIPRAIASEMILTGKQIDAQEAYRVGLVNEVVPRDQLMPTAKKWAELICEAGPLQVRAAKEGLIRGYDLTLEESDKLVRELAASLRGTEDAKEGARAFVEKRKPEWKGR
jgi:enoyl-CoA hydratase/carnithine racemase